MTNIQAIDLLKNLEQRLDDYCELNDEGKTAFRMAITALEVFGNSEQLPSAQPEKRTNKRTETHACDCISRQAAIDLWEQYHPYIATKACEYDTMLRQLPSAQPSGKDPIEREAVVDILHDAMQGCGESEENLIGEIVCKVDLLPSAQPYTEDEIQKIQDLEQAQLDKMYELGKQTAQAEIIHCRECKHWKTDHPTANGYHCCHRIHNAFPMREDDFCSRAERREND